MVLFFILDYQSTCNARHQRARVMCTSGSTGSYGDLSKSEKWDNAFLFNGALSRHLCLQSGEKPYKCEECDKTFSFNGALRRHLSLHSGDRPYKCGKAFFLINII